MPGYIATSQSHLNLALGPQNLQTQSALAYLTGETVQIVYTLNQSVYMIGTVTAYNAVTGLMTVNVTNLATAGIQLQPVWNTATWGSAGGPLNSWNLFLIGGVPASTTAVVPTIIVRNQGTAWDAQRGNGLQNFLTDVDAVAQIINSRLRLLQGEWFEDTSLGLPLFQQLLGHPITNQAVALIVRQQILATPFVLGIAGGPVVMFSPGGKVFTFQAVVDTQFGQITIASN